MSAEAATEKIKNALTSILGTLSVVDSSILNYDSVDEGTKIALRNLYERFPEVTDGEEEATETQNNIHAKLITTNMRLSEAIATLTERNEELSRQVQGHQPTVEMPRPSPTDTDMPKPMPKVTKSQNPIPIKPTNPSRKTLVQRIPANPASRNHPKRLIIETYPLIPAARRLIGPEVVDRANQEIQRRSMASKVTVMAVMFSMSGNVIAIAGPGNEATDLTNFADIIVRAIDPEFIPERIESHGDTQRFKVKLDRVPTYNAHGNRTTPQEIHEATKWSYPDFKEMTQAAPPAWLGSEENIAKQRTASVVFSFTKIDEAKQFRAQHTIFILGMPCHTAPYEERPRPIYCGRCGSLSHREFMCKGDCCQTCTSPDHTTAEHPEEIKPKCINCSREHEAKSRDCDRLAKILGRPSVNPPHPAGGATPVNGPRKPRTKKTIGEPAGEMTTVYYRGTQVPESDVINIGEGIRGPSSQWLAKYHQTMHAHWKKATARPQETSDPWRKWGGPVIDDWDNPPDERERATQTPGAGPSNHQAERSHSPSQN
ncbi:hypothetical protein BS47DRAFT_1390358 [Hydnum rufescens UP504]|uniref:Gag-like protein n=1 Tax=Hydnum rufescens UP504 TaxID=1448309 RepID=A0A9P6B321_9AGAM|nr:hypothetical protein BS47DRAFT_1390358 [Hydnum rufescens UP504]